MVNFHKVVKALKKALNSNSDDEKKQLASKLEKAGQVFQSKEFLAEFEENLHNEEVDIDKEIIEKTINIVTKLIKQMKIKSEVESITIQVESYEFPFPPVVIITTENEEIELENEFIKPKELHYEYDAFSGDYNLDNANNIKVILETYQHIIAEFNKFDWKRICNTSDKFEVKFIKP